ncbi:hypothetical protein H6F32_04590 [Anabaena sp. FACHB-1237]|nr:hypothetical protein [Anabaena sp. FACHB-1237]
MLLLELTMAEKNRPLINELLMQMGKHPEIETWRQKGKHPTTNFYYTSR